jgi:hypothetical protein
MKKFVLLAAALVLSSACLTAQTPRPSPAASATCSFSNGKTVTINYSSPRMKSRKIFGGLVPYGEVWRLGANEATTVVTTTDVTIGSKRIPAGSYTLFALPNADKWTLIISKKTGEWGIPYPGEGDDFARVDMTISRLPSPLDNFTIGFDQAGSKCKVHFDWDTTRAWVTIEEAK